MNQKGWRLFLKLCLISKDEKMLSELLDLFLTPEEIASIETRTLIVKELLKENLTQRQIADDINVSIAKITRGSNELKRISEKLKQFLQENLLA